MQQGQGTVDARSEGRFRGSRTLGAVAAVALLVLGLAACGSDDDDSSKTTGTNGEQRPKAGFAGDESDPNTKFYLPVGTKVTIRRSPTTPGFCVNPDTYVEQVTTTSNPQELHVDVPTVSTTRKCNDAIIAWSSFNVNIDLAAGRSYGGDISISQPIHSSGYSMSCRSKFPPGDQYDWGGTIRCEPKNTDAGVINFQPAP